MAAKQDYPPRPYNQDRTSFRLLFLENIGIRKCFSTWYRKNVDALFLHTIHFSFRNSLKLTTATVGL